MKRSCACIEVDDPYEANTDPVFSDDSMSSYIELVYKGHDTRWPFVDSVVSDKLTNYVYAAYRPPKTDLLNHRFPKYGDIEMGNAMIRFDRIGKMLLEAYSKVGPEISWGKA